MKADEDALKRVERDGKPGARVEVTIFRRKRLLTVPVVLGETRAFAYEIVARAAADARARRLGRRWLGRPLPA